MNVAQETLGFRRAGLSPALSLLMSAFALPIPAAELYSPPSQAYGTLSYRTRNQNSGIGDQTRLIKPCSILAICSYSSRHRCQVDWSIYPRSKQYRLQTRISSAEPILIRMNRLNSALDWDCLPNPSAKFAQLALLSR